MTSHPAAAFSRDFDGTVCPQDVGYRLFNHFSNGKNDDLIPKWISGDGYTDICGEREADVVFARKELIDYCREHDIDYLTFSDFEDILRLCRENGLLK